MGGIELRFINALSGRSGWPESTSEALRKQNDSRFKRKKARRFLPSAAPTIPTGGKGYSTVKSIEDLAVGGNVRYRTLEQQDRHPYFVLFVLFPVRKRGG